MLPPREKIQPGPRRRILKAQRRRAGPSKKEIAVPHISRCLYDLADKMYSERRCPLVKSSSFRSATLAADMNGWGFFGGILFLRDVRFSTWVLCGKLV